MLLPVLVCSERVVTVMAVAGGLPSPGEDIAYLDIHRRLDQDLMPDSLDLSKVPMHWESRPDQQPCIEVITEQRFVPSAENRWLGHLPEVPFLTGAVLPEALRRQVVALLSAIFAAYPVSVALQCSDRASIHVQQTFIVQAQLPGSSRAVFSSRTLGVALLNSWNGHTIAPASLVLYQNVLVDDALALARVIAHEVGHTLGLLHDHRAGQGMDTYYSGVVPHLTAPVMGDSLNAYAAHWSRGYYLQGLHEFHKQDDPKLIAERLAALGGIDASVQLWPSQPCAAVGRSVVALPLPDCLTNGACRLLTVNVHTRLSENSVAVLNDPSKDAYASEASGLVCLVPVDDTKQALHWLGLEQLVLKDSERIEDPFHQLCHYPRYRVRASVRRLTWGAVGYLVVLAVAYLTRNNFFT